MNYVCLSCGTEYDGRLDIPVFDYCDECDSIAHYGLRDEFEA